MTKPGNSMRKAAETLFPDPDEREAFLAALLEPPPRGHAILWTVPRREGEFAALPRESLPGWLPECVELLESGARPGRSPAYAAGEIYPLDFSSVVAASAMLAARPLLPEAPWVLDLCAAPGGKSILASALLRPGLILANEVEARRLGPLRHNLSRCRVDHAHTQRLAPEEIARLAPGAFDLCLVDAPCSGQSLLVKGIENPGCFHPATVKGNARRQLRILSTAAETVGPGGFLLYTTCTFSPRENEGVVERFLGQAPDFSAVGVPHLHDRRSGRADFPCYRDFPHRSPGAGGFAALLRRGGEPRGDHPGTLPAPLLDYPVTVPSSAEAD